MHPPHRPHAVIGAPGLSSQEFVITTEKRSPLVLDTHELSRRPGTMREVARVVAAPADLGTAVIGVPEGADLTLGLRLEAVLEGVLVTGVVRGTAVGECVRCLDEVRDEVTVRVQELFVYPERAEAADDAGDEDAEDEPELTDDLADLEPVVRDSLVTALPFQPLCRQDCPGLCSECGARLEDDPEHHHDVVDPRWAALQTMLEESSVSDETKES